MLVPEDASLDPAETALCICKIVNLTRDTCLAMSGSIPLPRAQSPRFRDHRLAGPSDRPEACSR
jgi:hypothetical protein